MVNEALRDGAAAATVDELSGQTLLAGGIWVVASSALPQIYVLASSILIARFLTVDDMGHQSYIAFVSNHRPGNIDVCVYDRKTGSVIVSPTADTDPTANCENPHLN